LLLDEMWSPSIASELRRRGHDVVAVAERDDLRGKPDEDVFIAAQRERRAIVTENVADYRPLILSSLASGSTHSGLILTSNRRFPRSERAVAGQVISALLELLAGDHDLTNREWWL
jgi:hypothetical protein